jgi:hypothetical protein
MAKKRKDKILMDDETDPMIPKRVVAPGILTTGMTIKGTPVSLASGSGIGAVTTEVVRARQWANDQAFYSGGLASRPTVLELSSELSFTTGVYITAAPTGAGKTVLSMALTAYSNAIGMAATYINCFEPRAPSWDINARSMFKDPSVFWDDVAYALGLTSKATPRIIVFDSATLPLSAFASKDQYRGQATFPGGMQPSARGFTDEGSKLALAYNAVILLNVNSSLIPYVSLLAGGTEGIIQIQDVANFTISDRSSTSKRTVTEVSLPLPYVNSALAYFGYGAYNRSQGQKWGRAVIGA